MMPLCVCVCACVCVCVCVLAGVLLWEIFTGADTPYGKIPQNVVADMICSDSQRLSQPDHCPADVFHVMSSCWITVRNQVFSLSTIITRTCLD